MSQEASADVIRGCRAAHPALLQDVTGGEDIYVNLPVHALLCHSCIHTQGWQGGNAVLRLSDGGPVAA